MTGDGTDSIVRAGVALLNGAPVRFFRLPENHRLESLKSPEAAAE